MRTLKITVRTLQYFGACWRGCDRFADLYPRGVVLTDDQGSNFELLSAGAIAEYEGADFCGHDITDLYWLAATIDGTSKIVYLNWVDDMCGRSRLFYVAGLLADAVGCRAVARTRGR